MYQHARQNSVTMTKCLRQPPSNEERLIWLIALAISEHGWLALSALTVVRQDMVAGAYDRVRPFSSREPGSEMGRGRVGGSSVLLKGTLSQPSFP